MQQLDFRLRQQRLLPLILSGQDLRRQQLRNPLPQRAVDGAKQAVFRFIEFNGTDDPLIFAAQRDNQRRAQLAVRMNRAAVRHLVAVGVNDFAGIDRLLGIERRDGFAREVVIVADPGKRQQLVAIGYRHRADIQLLDQHLRDLHAVLFVEPLAQDPLRRSGDLQRRSRKGRGVFFKHCSLIQQDAHK